MNKRSISYKLLSGFLIAASLTACSKSPAPETASAPATAATATKTATLPQPILVSYDKEDEASDWSAANPTDIELKGATATLSDGSNAAIKGNQIMILSAGIYVISGKLTNGQILVDSQTKGTVRLVLNGAEIQSSDSAAIFVKNPTRRSLRWRTG